MLDSSGYIEWLLKFDKHISHDPIRNNPTAYYSLCFVFAEFWPARLAPNASIFMDGWVKGKMQYTTIPLAMTTPPLRRVVGGPC